MNLRRVLFWVWKGGAALSDRGLQSVFQGYRLREVSKPFLNFRKGEQEMITKREKKLWVSWFSYKTLPLIFLLYIVLCLISTPSLTGADYIFTEFWAPSGLSQAYPIGIDDQGVVIGNGIDYNSNHWRSFLYSGGTFTELLPDGWASAIATDINKDGVVVGYSDGGSKMFVYTEGGYTELLPPPGCYTVFATGINNKGVVLGICDYEGKLFLYSKGTYTELLFPFSSYVRPLDINDKGDVVGYFFDYDDATGKGFLYSKGTYTELLPNGWIFSSTGDINNKGVVVGYGQDSEYISRGFLCERGTCTEFSTPSGWNWARPVAINDKGDIVGEGGQDGTTKVFVCSGKTCTALLPPGWGYAHASGINNNGAVIGYIEIADTFKWFIATPSPKKMGSKD
jgi:uncharacterized membrane protein